MFRKDLATAFPEQPKGIFFRMLPGLVGTIIPPLIRLWGFSWRSRLGDTHHLRDAARAGGVLLATWHGDLMTPLYLSRDQGWIVLVSPVWEGELIARMVSGLGYGLIRASSGYHPSRGLRQCLKALHKDEHVVIILDGPQGPRRVVKPGVINLASLSGRPIIPAFGGAQHFIRLPSWDRQAIALPFTKTELRFGEPLYIPKPLDDDQRKHLQVDLKRQLLKLEKKVIHSLVSSN